MADSTLGDSIIAGSTVLAALIARYLPEGRRPREDHERRQSRRLTHRRSGEKARRHRGGDPEDPDR